MGREGCGKCVEDIWVCLKIGDTHIHSNFNGENGDNPLEYEIHYFQTNAFEDVF